MTDITVVEATEVYSLVSIRGRLDPEGVGAVELALTSHTVARHKPAVIDLTDVTFIGSIGIGMLVAIGQSMRSHGVGLAVVAKGTVKEILDALTIGSLFPVAGTREEAFRALSMKH